MSMDIIDTHEDIRSVDLDIVEEVQAGDHDLFTHIVNPPNNLHIWREGMTAQQIVDVARDLGWPVKALCGKTWIATHNPEKYPACPECMDIAHKIMSEMG